MSTEDGRTRQRPEPFTPQPLDHPTGVDRMDPVGFTANYLSCKDFRQVCFPTVCILVSMRATDTPSHDFDFLYFLAVPLPFDQHKDQPIHALVVLKDFHPIVVLPSQRQNFSYRITRLGEPEYNVAQLRNCLPPVFQKLNLRLDST
ncbi:hypothetical protein GWI33_007225 [Rhynchophorus ferrugineus]|uniref:Uncharacterized protein n=1 Tax=Rhynchophorus ferrugineus TaxID=354439 RepID=A0A834MCC0_RHYFE|nr:hypothetical protein GWI33_007225 [Rhynchophorus ferrugineus]